MKAVALLILAAAFPALASAQERLYKGYLYRAFVEDKHDFVYFGISNDGHTFTDKISGLSDELQERMHRCRSGKYAIAVVSRDRIVQTSKDHWFYGKGSRSKLVEWVSVTCVPSNPEFEKRWEANAGESLRF